MTDIIQYEGIENLGTTTDLINGKPIYDLDRIIETSGFTTAGDGGSGKWKQNGITGQTPSQTPAQLGDALLNDASGNQWVLVTQGALNVMQLGAKNNNTTDCIGSINAAVNSGTRSVFFPSGNYSISSGIVINKSTVSLVGAEGMDSIITPTSSVSGSVITFSPSDPLSTGFLNGQGLENILIAGTDSQENALSVIKAERFNGKNIRWGGCKSGLLISGGQFNSFSSIKATPPTSYNAGSYAIRTQGAQTSSGYQQAYSINISDIFATGAPSKKYDYIFDINNSDGLNILSGYVAFARTALMNIEPKNDLNSAVIQVGEVYFDGVFKSTEGSPTGILIPQTAQTGSSSVTLSNCFLGQYSGSAVTLLTDAPARVTLSACVLANCTNYGFSSSATNANINITGCDIAKNNAGGVKVLDAKSAIITGNSFDSNFNDGAILFGGLITELQYGMNTFNLNSIDVTDNSTGSSNTLSASFGGVYDYSPSLTFGGGSTGIVYSKNIGVYSRVGDFITANIEIILADKGSSTGQAKITLPLTSKGGDPNSAAAVYTTNLSTTIDLVMSNIEDGSATITLNKFSNGASIPMTSGDFNNNSLIRLSVNYRQQ